MKLVVPVALALALSIASLAGRSAAPPRSGEQIYQTYCGVCHSGGWQGAPIANDKRDWEERVAKGFDLLFKNAKQGLNAMPPMGTCMDCTDEELQESIKAMLAF